jgi:hypothetical protein
LPSWVWLLPSVLSHQSGLSLKTFEKPFLLFLTL